MGDLNSRTGKYPTSVSQEGSNIITNDQSEYALSFSQRNSFDNELNNHRKRLLEICRSADLRILNGRLSGDSLGRATFHGRNGTCKRRWLRNMWPRFTLSVAHFVVKEPSFFSDHSPVITWLNVETNICNKSIAHANDTLKRLPRQFCWENDSTQKFKDTLRSSSTQLLIQEFLNENAPITNEKVEHTLIATAKRCFKIKSVKRHKRVESSSKKKWFDKECRFKRHELRKLANQKHRDPFNVTLCEEYHAVLKQYKTVLNNTRKEYYNNKISELEDTTFNRLIRNTFTLSKINGCLTLSLSPFIP